MTRLDYEFFHRPCPEVARDLVGKVIAFGEKRLRITQTECYCGESDTACHASRGRTKRTEVMYMEAGRVYVYLCYGMHWMLNIVTGEEGHPEAVLIRACEGADGPGKLTKALGITGTENRSSVVWEDGIRILDDGFSCDVETGKRVGIGYASRADQDRLWRFKIKPTAGA